MTWFERLDLRITFPTNSRHDHIAVLCGLLRHHFPSHLNSEVATSLTASFDHAKGTTGEETLGINMTRDDGLDEG